MTTQQKFIAFQRETILTLCDTLRDCRDDDDDDAYTRDVDAIRDVCNATTIDNVCRALCDASYDVQSLMMILCDALKIDIDAQNDNALFALYDELKSSLNITIDARDYDT